MRSIKSISIVFLVVMLSACTISQNVSPVGEAIFIEKVYVKDNPKAHMKELVNELVTQIDELGFYSEKFEGNRPLDATHYLEYTANWAWDMAMYLTFFEAKLYDGGQLIGEVSYDARSGGGNMGKFGRTAEKIQPLLTELFEKVERPKK
jgi:hypothetical protein